MAQQDRLSAEGCHRTQRGAKIIVLREGVIQTADHQRTGARGVIVQHFDANLPQGGMRRPSVSPVIVIA
jgi:hypothetical protein